MLILFFEIAELFVIAVTRVTQNTIESLKKSETWKRRCPMEIFVFDIEDSIS